MKKQKIKKCLSVFLAVTIIITVIPFAGFLLKVSAISYDEIVSRLDYAKTIYKNGDVWCGTYIANNGSEGPWTCFGFACEIFRIIYGCEMPRSYTANGTSHYYKLVVNSSSNVTEVGSLNPKSYSSTDVKNLLLQADAGYVIQAASASSQHTMIVNYVDDNGISLYDANSDLNNGIRTNAYYTWSQFYSWRAYGISLYKYVNYPEHQQQHTHHYEYGYEAAHPHRVYYRCSCGDWYYSGDYTTMPGCAECAVHVHNYEWSYEREHPHREYKKCSCGDYYYTGAEAATYELGYESVHPHREYNHCKICGQNFLTGTYKTVSGCPECVAPSYSKLSIGKTSYTVGDTIMFTCDSDTAEYYTIGIDKDGTRMLTKKVGHIYYYKCDKPGSYSAYVSAVNSYGYIDSNRVSWTVREKTLTVIYNANGGSLNSTRFKLQSNVIYDSSSNCKFDIWTYNNKKENGLYNASTFGLSRSGYTFLGWSTDPSTGSILDQNNTDLVPTDITSSIKNGDCTVTLYARWLANSVTMSYNGNGGSGSVASQTAKANGDFAIAENGFCKTGYTFEGWNVKRNSDSKWYVYGQGWFTESEISKNGFTKRLYKSGKTFNFDWSWSNGLNSASDYTFYAVWRPNSLNITYNVNGGIIDSSKYKAVSDSVYKISTNTELVVNVEYNNTQPNGLYNAETFGLYRKGYTFLGWGTTINSETIFNQDDSTVVPTDITSDILNGDCSVTLYARWEHDTFAETDESNIAIKDKFVFGDNLLGMTGSKLAEQFTNNNISLVPTNRISTGYTIYLIDDTNMVYDTRIVVIFGDVNGDGWYDGMDAMIVSCLANGMLSESDVGEAVYMAADCNHDGSIDSLDVELLQQAGVLLADVDQSQSAEELLETSSAYAEYLNLIDQTVETAEDDTAKTVEETPAEKEPVSSNWFRMIVSFLKMLLNFVYGLLTL